ncbi:PAS domain S-box-containing protein [Methanolinea mesophila]|uniref:PAS domain S-box protein n=1 Tax=Methanolinea mesophila TaxID=547055 RepID=UPI001AE23B13|nr:PAS domain S-box protein [Methanolinea mesophila]MBP1929016.1 PAS domain S-box-containing protein [Methanolinea mesophila]
MADPEGREYAGERFGVLTDRGRPVFGITGRIWEALILLSVVITLAVTLYSLSLGVTTVFAQLYYIPIVLLAFYYRRTGVFLSVLLSLVYLALTALFMPGNIVEIWGAGIRVFFFIVVAVLVALLSEQLSRSRDELRDVADLLESSMMNAQVWLTVLGANGTVLLWNKAAERISGYPATDVVGKNDIWKKLYPDPEYRRVMTSNITRIIGEKDFLSNLEATIVCRDGEKKTISWNTRMLPVHGEARFIVIGVDITEQKRAESISSEYILYLEDLEKIEEIIRKEADPDRMITRVLDLAREILESDRAWLLYPGDPEAGSFRVPMIRSREEWALDFSPDAEIAVTPDVADAFRDALRTEGPVIFDPTSARAVPLGDRFSIRSQIIMALHPRRGKAWIFGLHHCTHPHAWTNKEQRLFTEIGRRLADGLSSMLLLSELRESEKKYRTVFETTGTAMVVLEGDTTISLANSEFVRLSGFPREALEGKKHWTEFVLPEDLDRMKNQHMLRRENPEQALRQYEFRFLRGNGEVRDILLTVDIIPGTRKSVASLLDITARKEEERALKQAYDDISELDFIVRNSPAVAFLWRAVEGWPVEYVSANIEYFGYSPDDFTSGRIPYSTIILPEDLSRVTSEIGRYSAEPGRTHFTQEYRILTSGREIRWVEDWTWIRRDDKGTITHYQGIISDITTRKEAEAALKTSEENYRDLVENINDIIISLDTRGVVTYISPVVKQVTGYTPEEIVGHPYVEFVYPGDIPAINEAFRETLAGHSMHVEFRLVRPDGSLIWFRTRSRIIAGPDGTPQGLYGVVSDISEQKEAEEARKATEERYHNVLDTMMEGCQIIDFDWRYRYVNEAVALQGRRTREELLGERMMDAYPGIEHTELFEVLNHCMKDRVQTRIVNKFVYPGGGSGWFELSIQPVPEGIFILSMDVTDRKNAEDMLAESEKRFRTLYETMTEGVIYQDRYGKVLFANPAAERILGLSIDQMQGRKPMDPRWQAVREDGAVFPLEEQPAMRTLRSGEPSKEMLGIFNPERGQFNWLMVNSVPLIEPGEERPSGVYTTFEDITAQQNARESLAHLNRVLMTIRSVNRLITEASDRDTLMDRVAVSLVQERGYSQVWILIQDPTGRPLHLSSAGMEECEQEFRRWIAEGRFPACVGEARDHSGVVHVLENTPECNGCPLRGLGKDILVSGLRAEGVIYGVISAVLPGGLSIDPEEEEIFSEVAHDLGFALHHLEVWERERAAVAALAQSEENYRNLVENIAEVIYTVDTTGLITYFSPAIREMLGYLPEEVIGRPFMDYVVPEDREALAKVYQESLKGRNVRVEFRGYDRQGGIHVLSAMSNAVYEDGGTTVTGLTGILTDVTEQKRIETERELQNARVRALLEIHALAEAPEDDIRNSALEGGIRITGSRFGFLGLVSEDESVLSIHAWSKGTMPKCAVSRVPLHYPVATAGIWAECIRSRRAIVVNDYPAYEGKKGYPEGHVPILRFMAVPVFEGNRIRTVVAVANKEGPYTEEDVGALTTLGNTFWELIQRRSAEQDLRTRQHQLVEAQSLAHVGSLEYNIPEGTLVWSDELSKIVGITPEQVPASPEEFIRFIVPEDRERVRAAMEEVIRDGGERDLEHGIIRQDGSIKIVHFRIRTITDGQGNPVRVIGTSQDITEQKEAEERIASAIAQIARNLEQMAILNDSIRNPLSVIVGLADMGGGRTNEKIIRAAKEIDDIITELDRGWIESDKVRRFLQLHHHLYGEAEREEQEKQ